MTVRTITGNVNTLAGLDIPNATFSLVPETYVFGSASSDVVFGEQVTVTADGSGDVSFDLHEGKYIGRISTSQGPKTFRLTVDSLGPWELGRLIGPLDAANIPPLISAAFNAADGASGFADKAEEWAQNPEDTPVETGPDQFSALHWAAKAEAAAVLAQSAGRQYVTRAAFVADTGYVSGADAPVDGTVVTAGGLAYERSTGATALTGLLGWLPFGRAFPAHYGISGDVLIPTHFATLQEAFDTFGPDQPQPIAIMIEAGHELTSGVSLVGGDWSRFEIASSGIVVLSSGFPALENIITLDNARGLVLGCLIDANGRGRHGISVTNGGSVSVKSGCGVHRAGYFGLLTNRGATASADLSVFTQAGASGVSPATVDATGISARRASFISARGADVSGSLKYGMSAAMASKINAQNAIADDCPVYGIRADEASEVLATGASCQRAGASGFYALRGSLIACGHSTAIDAGSRGYYAAQGSRIEAAGADASGSGGQGFLALDKSDINALGSSANDCASQGYYADRGSTINAQSAQANRNLHGFSAFRASTINAEGSTASDNTSNGFLASRASTINAGGATATNNTSWAVRAERGSNVNFVSGTASGSGETNDIVVASGSIIAANSSTGSISLTANTLSASGVIFR